MLRAFLLAALCLSATFAHADVYDFTFTGINGAQCYGSEDCQPGVFGVEYDLTTPTSYTADSTAYVDGVMEFDLYAQGFAINFDTTDTSGLFGLTDGFGVDAGNTITSGPTSHPVVLPGTYLGGALYVYNSDEFYDTNTVLTITDVSAVPEPASWLLVGTGVVVLAGLYLQRRRECLM